MSKGKSYRNKARHNILKARDNGRKLDARRYDKRQYDKPVSEES